jgi:hypothetical protein
LDEESENYLFTGYKLEKIKEKRRKRQEKLNKLEQAKKEEAEKMKFSLTDGIIEPINDLTIIDEITEDSQNDSVEANNNLENNADSRAKNILSQKGAINFYHIPEKGVGVGKGSANIPLDVMRSYEWEKLASSKHEKKKKMMELRKRKMRQLLQIKQRQLEVKRRAKEAEETRILKGLEESTSPLDNPSVSPRINFEKLEYSSFFPLKDISDTESLDEFCFKDRFDSIQNSPITHIPKKVLFFSTSVGKLTPLIIEKRNDEVQKKLEKKVNIKRRSGETWYSFFCKEHEDLVSLQNDVDPTLLSTENYIGQVDNLQNNTQIILKAQQKSPSSSNKGLNKIPTFNAIRRGGEIHRKDMKKKIKEEEEARKRLEEQKRLKLEKKLKARPKLLFNQRDLMKKLPQEYQLKILLNTVNININDENLKDCDSEKEKDSIMSSSILGNSVVNFLSSNSGKTNELSNSKIIDLCDPNKVCTPGLSYSPSRSIEFNEICNSEREGASVGTTSLPSFLDFETALKKKLGSRKQKNGRFKSSVMGIYPVNYMKPTISNKILENEKEKSRGVKIFSYKNNTPKTTNMKTENIEIEKKNINNEGDEVENLEKPLLDGIDDIYKDDKYYGKKSIFRPENLRGIPSSSYNGIYPNYLDPNDDNSKDFRNSLSIADKLHGEIIKSLMNERLEIPSTSDKIIKSKSKNSSFCSSLNKENLYFGHLKKPKKERALSASAIAFLDKLPLLDDLHEINENNHECFNNNIINKISEKKKFIRTTPTTAPFSSTKITSTPLINIPPYVSSLSSYKNSSPNKVSIENTAQFLKKKISPYESLFPPNFSLIDNNNSNSKQKVIKTKEEKQSVINKKLSLPAPKSFLEIDSSQYGRFPFTNGETNSTFYYNYFFFYYY